MAKSGGSSKTEDEKLEKEEGAIERSRRMYRLIHPGREHFNNMLSARIAVANADGTGVKLSCPSNSTRGTRKKNRRSRTSTGFDSLGGGYYSQDPKP